MADYRTLLDEYLAQAPTVQMLTEFLEWLDGQKREVGQWTETHRYMVPVHEGRTEMIFRFLEIDSVALENARRELLAQQSGSLPQREPLGRK